MINSVEVPVNIPKWAVEPGKAVARRLPFPVVEATLFPHEGAWLRLGRKSPGRQEPSVLFFSLHKVASSFTHHMLTYLNTELLGLRRMDWDGYAYNRFDVSAAEWASANADDIFRSTGYCYGVFRAPLPIRDLENYRILMIVRDPRDILTSWYFSDAFSHAEPLRPGRLEKFERYRNIALDQTIDEYVHGVKADYLEKQLEGYRRLLSARGTQPLLYETMQLDWNTFMDQVSEQLGVEISVHHRQRLREMGGIGESLSGDVNEHRRKGSPGDFAEKLSDESIEALNARFGPYLEWMNLPV